jgi:SAM-dependent methyltransferase
MSEPEALQSKVRRALRRRWLIHGLRDVSDNDNHQGLERLYRLEDPWNLDSPLEHTRFDATNNVIHSQFGVVDSLLEIGCSEGVQSVYLRRMCNSLYGIDVSATAVQRARKRMPDAQFACGDLLQQDLSHQGKRFDLVVACEVLYYMTDPGLVIAEMNRLGDACLVSFFAPEACKLATLMESMPQVQKGWICHGDVTWLLAWWRNPLRTGKQ